MPQQARRIRLLPDSRNPAEAARIVTAPGDASLVVRGMVRSLVLRCPCGCGENYIINLDPRGGPAWRYYRRNGNFTLYPSYWRDGGCGSHFIVHRNEIWWCNYDEEWVTEYDSALLERIVNVLPDEAALGPRDIADQLNEIPWEVRAACEKLVHQRQLDRIGRGVDTRYRKRAK